MKNKSLKTWEHKISGKVRGIQIMIRRNKYNISPREDRTADGIVFDSKKEMNFYLELKLRKKAHDIKDFQRQVKYIFYNHNKKMFTYKADFVVDYFDGRREVIDVKGVRTALYILKKKLIESEYGITIVEI